MPRVTTRSTGAAANVRFTRERVLALWLKLAEGRLDEIEAEPWLPGYEDAEPNAASGGGGV